MRKGLLSQYLSVFLNSTLVFFLAITLLSCQEKKSDIPKQSPQPSSSPPAAKQPKVKPPTLSDELIKEMYLAYVVSVKMAQLKDRKTNSGNAKTYLRYASSILQKGYSIREEVVETVVDIGSQEGWERAIEDKSQMFDPQSPLHELAYLATLTDQENRMPTFQEIQKIARVALKYL